MKRICSFFAGIGVCLAILVFLAGSANAAPQKTRDMAKKAKPAKLEAKAAEGFEEVDLFQAIEDGQIEAGIIQNNMKGGRLFIENKTDKPLNVRMPAAFGTRPIVSQMAQQRQDDIEQLFGAGGNGGIMGGGGFNIPSEKVVSMKYESVCLEYGKPVPTSRSNYELAKIDDVTSKEEVKEMCKLIGTGVDLGALQFSAWHMNSGVPVQRLASETVLRANGKRTTYFSQAQVKAGMIISQRARVVAQQNAQAAAESHSSSASE